MKLNNHKMNTRFLAGVFILLLVNGFVACSKTKLSQSSGELLETKSHDVAIAQYVETLPKLDTAISSIDANGLVGNLNSLKGLEQDKKDALEALQRVEDDSRAVLSSHKLSYDMELTHNTALLSKILDLLNSDIAELVGQNPANHKNGFTWLAALADSDNSTTTFEVDSYVFLLKRAKAIELAGDPTLKQ